MSLVLYAFACFCKVFLAILQAKNVQHTAYLAAFGTSLLMSVADVIYIRLAVSNHVIAAILFGGVANATAVVLALKFYSRFKRPQEVSE